MDVTATRSANLRALVDAALAGGATMTGLAPGFGMAQSYLSQLYGGKKIGDKVARKIEAARRLPHGWMDSPRGSQGLPEASQRVRVAVDTMEHALALLRMFLAFAGRPEGEIQNARYLAAALEIVSNDTLPEHELAALLARRIREADAIDSGDARPIRQDR